MLPIFRHGVKRAMCGVGLVALALASSSCSAVLSGTHDTTFDFLVAPLPAGTFQGWTDITLGEDISSFGQAELYGVTLQVEKPPGVADLSFMSTLTAYAVTASGENKQMAHVEGFQRGETSVQMHVDYFGDLHPLFKDAHTIHIIWVGDANPAFTSWPADGIWVSGDVTINLD